MGKWLTLFLAATIASCSAVPVFADTTNPAMTDHITIYSDLVTAPAGATAHLHLYFSSASSSSANLQVQTTLGSLNGNGGGVSVSATNGSTQNLTLSSTAIGLATIYVYENGVLLGSTQVNFVPGPLGNITIQASTNNQYVGGTSTISISATDAYGNFIPDSLMGTSFTITTTQGQLTLQSGTNYFNSGSAVSVGTRNGVALVNLTSNVAGTAVVTVTDTNLPSGVKVNGMAQASVVTLLITFSYGQSVAITQMDDFKDVIQLPLYELESERELAEIGVLHGDSNHYYYPLSTLKRSEFATIVAQYMGLGTVASNLQGTQTKFSDVNPNAWYDGAVAAISSLGYVKGDGTNFYPENSISYAEVAQVLLNNLGVQTTGTWPDKAISGGQTYGLFKGLGSFAANDAATRGDVAIMVRNALHLVPQFGNFGSSTKTLEAETLGYTWYGDDQAALVTAVPGAGFSSGNEIQVEMGGQMTTLHLANTVQVTEATSLNGLLNKNIKYLTNGMGLVTYIEVVPE